MPQVLPINLKHVWGVPRKLEIELVGTELKKFEILLAACRQHGVIESSFPAAKQGDSSSEGGFPSYFQSHLPLPSRANPHHIPGFIRITSPHSCRLL